MAYKPKRWPYHAHWALEDTLAALRDIEHHADEIQRAARDGNILIAAVAAGDIRKRVSDATVALVRARNGDYA